MYSAKAWLTGKKKKKFSVPLGRDSSPLCATTSASHNHFHLQRAASLVYKI